MIALITSSFIEVNPELTAEANFYKTGKKGNSDMILGDPNNYVVSEYWISMTYDGEDMSKM